MKKKLLLSKEQVTEIYFKIMVNQLEMFAVGVGIIGYGIFLNINPSTIKHSCIPNVLRKFDGKKMTLKAVDKIENFSDIRMTYSPIYQEDVKIRRSYLKQHYCFTCHCKFCEDEDLESMLEASMLCSECDGGCIPFTPKMSCLDCNAKVSPEMFAKYWQIKWNLDLPQDFQRLKQASKSGYDIGANYDLRKYEDLFVKALEIFHPLDRTFYKLSEMTKFAICGTFDGIMNVKMESLTEKQLNLLLKMAQISAMKARKLLPPFQTETSLHEFEIAMIYAFLGEIDKADEAFKRYTVIERMFNAPQDNLPLTFYEELRLRRIKLEEAKKKKDYHGDEKK